MFHTTVFLYHRKTQACVLWRCKFSPNNVYCVWNPTLRYSVDYKQWFHCHFLWVVLYCFCGGQGHALCWKFPARCIGLRIVGLCLCAAVTSLLELNCVLHYFHMVSYVVSVVDGNMPYVEATQTNKVTLYLYCPYRWVISKFNRYIPSNTTHQILLRIHYAGDMFRLTL
jgi:hypothetical protein